MDEVSVTRSRHGPFERISLVAANGKRTVMLSAYRLGDLLVAPDPRTAWLEAAADDLLRSWRGLAKSPFVMLQTHGEVMEQGERALREVADLVEREADRVREASRRLGTAEPAAVAQEVFGPERSLAAISEGEFSFAAFVRSVLDPVRALPATRVRIG